MSIHRLKTSASLEESGVEMVLLGTRIVVARAGGKNKVYVRALEKVARENKHALSLISDVESAQLFHELYADTVIQAWQTMIDGEWIDGIDDGKGGVIPATRENMIATFVDLPDLFTAIKDTAENAQYYRVQATIEAVKGN